MSKDKRKFTMASAASVVTEQLVNAEIDAVMDECKAAGKTPLETAEAVIGENGDGLAKTVCIVSLIKSFSDHYGLDYIKSPAFNGYRDILQHYPETDDAQSWWEFFITAETIGDVWRWFVKTTDVDPTGIVTIPGYDDAFFHEQLDHKLRPQFAANQTELDEMLQLALEEHESARAKHLPGKPEQQGDGNE